MPEGHTLRRLADDLSAAFAGRIVRVSSPQGRFAADAAVLDRSTLRGADSAGKHLFVEFEGERFVHVHLGLIGTFDVHTAVAHVEPPRGAVRLRLVSTALDQRVPGLGTAYADLRGAIVCELVTATRRDQVLAKLGPDPLRADAEPDLAWRRISRSPRAIGDLLMDQAVLAGVGNVYRAEVLFRGGLSPHRPGVAVSQAEFDALWADLVTLMRAGLRAGRIVTTRPAHRARRGTPWAEEAHYVYRRAGLPCRVCGTPVATEVMAGRNLFWCPGCQAA